MVTRVAGPLASLVPCRKSGDYRIDGEVDLRIGDRERPERVRPDGGDRA